MSENLQDDVPGSGTDAAPLSPVSNKRWYVVHAYSGMEKSVMRALKERIERAGMAKPVRPDPGARPKKWSKSRMAKSR